MKVDIPPIAKSQRSGFIDEKILEFSKELFEIPLYGFGIATILNIFYLYYWYKRASLFSLIYFIFLFYIISKAIQAKILGW